MASIEEQLRNVRTLEDLVNLLSILFTNLNNQNELYYDMFLNPVPMDLELERYNENGELVTVTLANRAKDLIRAYSGNGNPNGKQAANVGALYIDLSNSSNLYYKAQGTDSYGWVLLWSNGNLVYLAPNGDGSQVTDLNMDNAGSGTLKVEFGGTGTNLPINGLVKGRGEESFIAAEDGVDYLGPNSFTGMISYFPIDTIPEGWLICNGAKYTVSEEYPYQRLCNVLKDKYKIKAGDLAKNFYRYVNGSTTIYLDTETPCVGDPIYTSGALVDTSKSITAVVGNKITVKSGSTSTVYTKGTLSRYGKYYAYKNGSNVVYLDTAIPTLNSVVYSGLGVASLLIINSISEDTLSLWNGVSNVTYARSTSDDIVVTNSADNDVDGVTTFRVPNLIGKYIKGGVPLSAGQVGEAHVQGHAHYSSSNTGAEASHTHGVGTYQITGYFSANELVFKDDASENKWNNEWNKNNPFKVAKTNIISGSSPNNVFDNNVWQLNATKSKGFSGSSAAGSSHVHTINVNSTTVGTGKNEVDHMILVPVIKY